MTTHTPAEAADWHRAQGLSATAYEIRVDGKVVAGCLVTADYDLSGLLVQPNYRRRGLATALLDLAKSNHERLSLQCASDLVKFYEKRGFYIDGEVPGGFRMAWAKHGSEFLDIVLPPEDDIMEDGTLRPGAPDPNAPPVITEGTAKTGRTVDTPPPRPPQQPPGNRYRCPVCGSYDCRCHLGAEHREIDEP